MRVEFEIPGHLPSRANLHQHWTKRHRMAKRQRLAARLLTHAFVGFQLLADIKARGAVVRLSRISPRRLDTGDNEATAFKSIRDGIADALGVDDRDARISWVYSQAQGKPPRVLVSIEAAAVSEAGTEPAA